jgi:hypothetical protein
MICLGGVSPLRVIGLLANAWFAIKTIDIIEEQQGTPYTSVFWRKWVSLRNSARRLKDTSLEKNNVQSHEEKHS